MEVLPQLIAVMAGAPLAAGDTAGDAMVGGAAEMAFRTKVVHQAYPEVRMCRVLEVVDLDKGERRLW